MKDTNIGVRALGACELKDKHFPLPLENRAGLRQLQWVEEAGKGDWLGEVL